MSTSARMCTLSEREDEGSGPETLLAVRDPYSSDDEKVVKETCKQKLILPKNADGSEMTGPEVLFFFDLDYKPQVRPAVDLTDATVVEILEHIITFISGHESTTGSNGNYQWKNKTASEIYRIHLQSADYLTWMVQNDRLNFKTCSAVEWLEQVTIYKQLNISNNINPSTTSAVVGVVDLIELVYTQYTENRCQDSGGMKDVFRIIDKILPPTAKLKYNVKYLHPYFVHEEVASDQYNVFEARNSTVSVKPDLVYQVREQVFSKAVGKILIQFYELESSVEPNTSANELGDDVEHNTSIKVKPQQKTDAILTNTYKDSAIGYLKNSVPADCQSDHCTSKLTGEHALQLLGLAAERFSSKGCSITVETEQAMGLFMKNECLYFTKLVIDKEKFKLYEFSYFSPFSGRDQTEEREAEISYSNWCLDLTVANHRIALVIFLSEYLRYIDD